MEECNQKAAVRLLSSVTLERSLDDLSKILLDDRFKAIDLHRISFIPIKGLESYIRATSSKNEREATNDRCEGCHGNTSRITKSSIDNGAELVARESSNKQSEDGQLCAG